MYRGLLEEVINSAFYTLDTLNIRCFYGFIGLEEEYNRAEFKYGLIILRTKRFLGLMDKFGKLGITRPLSWFLVYLMPLMAGVAIYIFLSQLIILFSPRGQEVSAVVRSLGLRANLGIPGINPYLPIVYGWIALIVAIVLHEAAHGVVARSLGLKVKSSGLLFFLFIPVGAFVEVDDTQLLNAKFRDSSRVLGAGAGVNFLLAALCIFLLIFGVVPSMVPKANGIAVMNVVVDSPAYRAGILPGDFIVAINGTHVNSPENISSSPWYKPGVFLNISVYRNGMILNKGVFLGENPMNKTLGFVGIGDKSYQELASVVRFYSGSLLSYPALYFCIPTLPQCQNVVPFGSPLYAFYTSPLGPATVPVANLLYWIFFINFNLAILNSLPIYFFDGGQAFKLFIKALGKGRLSEINLNRITAATSTVILFMLLISIFGPYLNLGGL
jgi:membrane-associated protease RseP (regulator of RpoE activity)